MSDEVGRFGLTRRRLLGGVATIGAAAAGAGAGTAAYFQDTASSDGNDLRAGTLDLDVYDGTTLSWSLSNVAPGDGQIGRLEVNLANEGSLTADHLEIDVVNTGYEDADGDLASDDDGPESDTLIGAAGMAAYVRVTQITYVDTDSNLIDLAAPLTDVNGNGYLDLEDIADPANEGVLDDLDPPTPNAETVTEFLIDVTADASMPNRYQGDVLITEITFSLHQDEG